MLNGALLVGASKAFLGKAEVETSALRLFEAVHAASIPHHFESDALVFRHIRASSVSSGWHPLNSSSPL